MDSTGEDLHPNWRALATVHIPLKRFVLPGSGSTSATGSGSNKWQERRATHQISGISGSEVKQFYEEILSTTSTSTTATITSNKSKRTCVKNSQPQVMKKSFVPFDKNKYFRLAISNNVLELQSMEISEQNKNTRDAYGWTALMMAACEGAETSVKWLCQLGVDKEAKDRSGYSAVDLARRKGHLAIVCYLENEIEYGEMMKDLQQNSLPEHIEPFYCETCKHTFSETTKRVHQTSTVHQFNEKSKLPPNKLTKFNISVKNRGLQLMVKQGWDREHGLGPTQDGRLYPIKTVLRKARTGLGIDQPPARVTHFDAFDTRATQRRAPVPKQHHRSLNDIKREKVREWKRNRRLRRELS